MKKQNITIEYSDGNHGLDRSFDHMGVHSIEHVLPD